MRLTDVNFSVIIIAGPRKIAEMTLLKQNNHDL